MTAVLSPSKEVRSRFSSDPLRCPITQTYFLEESDISISKFIVPEFHHTDCTDVVSPASRSNSSSPDFTLSTVNHYPPTPTSLSSLSLSVSEDQEDSDLILPSYDSSQFDQKEPEPETLSEASIDSSVDFQRLTQTPAADDSTIEDEPSRHVDYLSHEWRQEDIWTSWRYVVARRNIYDNGVRLENASWRTWAKLKLNLGTVSPENLNWLKDCDVTWLYGPLKTCNRREKASNDSPPPSRLETPSLYPDRKPILKKRTASETILQRSLSQHTLLQHAGAILKAQEAETNRNRPTFQRCTSDIGQVLDNPSTALIGVSAHGTTATATTSSSGIGSPSERRHIHFNNEVVQCIAVEAKEESDEWPATHDGPSEDGVVMMKHIHSETSISDKSMSRGGFSSENKTIAPLPSTTLKYKRDTPEPPTISIMDRWSSYFSTSSLPSSAYAKSIQPSANFLLDEDDNDLAFDWEPSRASRSPVNSSHPWFVNPEDDEELDRYYSMSPGMSTAHEVEELSSSTILDRVTDTVNTAKDIAHVIWNVGWRR
ncbi:hypothetical protein BO70DRAFT_99157 [Aspergillus heteromorphus CBS 117.55]|uniref:Nitrogen regulatory protein areA GATA-like domain-containing protein n=1 Tax=Aspergillus heteromorphus CBS 117.55 TaxID=1448321 RepID=A0A317VQ28_9EURO|nr:uncharacterized protein BO70DRAFT_99157 [Aspergillus heteromorphus CBS 117.55]PWY74988.1 hypothetical protein BO70DRAFT_99157 [Aspergillus heteromorphus CBS 117.55]